MRRHLYDARRSATWTILNPGTDALTPASLWGLPFDGVRGTSPYGSALRLDGPRSSKCAFYHRLKSRTSHGTLLLDV